MTPSSLYSSSLCTDGIFYHANCGTLSPNLYLSIIWPQSCIHVSEYSTYSNQPEWLPNAGAIELAGQSLLTGSQDTQLTHHSTSGDFPNPVPLLHLPVGVISSPLPGQQQCTGALILHLCQRPTQTQLKHIVPRTHTLTTLIQFKRRTDVSLDSINCQVRK